MIQGSDYDRPWFSLKHCTELSDAVSVLRSCMQQSGSTRPLCRNLLGLRKLWYIADLLAYLQLLTSLNYKLEGRRRFVDQHDGASKSKSAHLLAGAQWLTSQNDGCIGIGSLMEGTRGDPTARTAHVCAQGIIKVDTNGSYISRT